MISGSVRTAFFKSSTGGWRMVNDSSTGGEAGCGSPPMAVSTGGRGEEELDMQVRPWLFLQEEEKLDVEVRPWLFLCLQQVDEEHLPPVT